MLRNILRGFQLAWQMLFNLGTREEETAPNFPGDFFWVAFVFVVLFCLKCFGGFVWLPGVGEKKLHNTRGAEASTLCPPGLVLVFVTKKSLWGTAEPTWLHPTSYAQLDHFTRLRQSCVIRMPTILVRILTES